MTLESLYDELGTLKWAGLSEGWNEAIEAVRKLLKDEIKPEKKEDRKKEFKFSDEKIKELEEMRPGVIAIPEPDNINPVYHQATLPIWDKCEVCGKDKKYVKGLSREMTCKYGHTTIHSQNQYNTSGYQPCIFDTIRSDSPTIMGISCSCPKCSPQC